MNLKDVTISTAKGIGGVVSRLTHSIAMAPVAEDLYVQAKHILASKTVYTIDISSIRNDYGMTYVQKVFKNLPRTIEKRGNLQDDIGSAGSYYDAVKYHGCPVIISVSCACGSVKLITANTEKCRKALDVFAEKLRQKASTAMTNNGNVWVTLQYGHPTFHNARSKRSFDTVFLPAETKSTILDEIRKFMENKEWYTKHNLPYHYGMLLYGPPGTGKSSIISCIANEFGFVPYYIHPSDIGEFIRNADDLSDTFSENSELKLIVIEDIDSCDFLNPLSEDGDKNDRKQYAKLTSDFLNAMDGTRCLENVLWLFTTNHIETLDPAIIRPGRVDRKLNIDYVCPESFKEFIEYHFHKDIDCDYVVPNTTFAEVQTDVMSGKGLEYICKKYTTKKVMGD